MMNSSIEIANVNFVEVVNQLQNTSVAYQNLWKCIVGKTPCFPCLVLYLHSGNSGTGAPNLIRLLHNPLGQQHLSNLAEIQSELKEVINAAQAKDLDFFQCKHLNSGHELSKFARGCN